MSLFIIFVCLFGVTLWLKRGIRPDVEECIVIINIVIINIAINIVITNKTYYATHPY